MVPETSHAKHPFRGRNSCYSEYSKMRDKIVNFMITVFRLYNRKNCGTITNYQQRRVFSSCIMYHQLLNVKRFLFY